MKVFIIGATGLLGSAAARELLARGHKVSGLALPPSPQQFVLPPGLDLTFGNLLAMTDEQILERICGFEGLVFAAGVDERLESDSNAYDMFYRYNILPLERLLPLAIEAGIRHVAVLGSYFVHFNRIWPARLLAARHPYIRSRADQEALALSFADQGLDVSVLELPYIFGAQPGRRPVWMFLVDTIRKMPLATFYPRGGTAMITLRQAGQCIAGALETTRGARSYPIGWFNLNWREMLEIFHRHLGLERPIITIPDWLFAMNGKRLKRDQLRCGIEGGLDLARLHEIMCDQAFIGREAACLELGVTEDDLDNAIGESVRLCLEIGQSPKLAIGMRGE